MAELDGLRAIAVGSVLFAHFVPVKYQISLPFGSAGVQLFFVLSGFLITSILLCSKGVKLSQSLKNFYARRFLRIFPLYYLVLTLCTLCGWMTWHEDLMWHVFYLSNVYVNKLGQWPEVGGHLWSLSVEEQFYLIWPLLVLLASKKSIVRITLSLMAISVLLRLAQPWCFADSKINVLLFCNLDALGWGSLIACFGPDAVNNLKHRHRWLIAAALLAIAGWLAKFGGLTTVAPLLHVGMVGLFGFVVAKCASGISSPVLGALLRHYLVRRIGMISYGLYVWHKFVPRMIKDTLDSCHAPLSWYDWLLLGHSKGMFFGLTSVATSVVLSLIVADLSWRLFESPINRLKRHFT